MSIRIHPYIHLNGRVEEAIKHYERTLGAKVELLTRYADVPGMQMPEEIKNLVIHATLKLGDEGVLMLSDATPDQPAASDTFVNIALVFDDAAELAAKFEALAKDGTVLVPPHEAFFGIFGMLTDAFGVRFMFTLLKAND